MIENELIDSLQDEKGFRAATSIEVKSLGCLWTDFTTWGSNQVDIT